MMKNVLVLIYTPTYGGPHNQVSQMYGVLKGKGWNTIAVIPEGDDISYQRLTDVGVTVVRKPLHRLRATKSIRTNSEYFRYFNDDVRLIEQLIEEYTISLVQICGLMHIHGAIAARRKNVPVVWQLLSIFAPRWMRAIYTPLVSRLSAVVMTTGYRVAREHPFHRLFAAKHINFYPPVNTHKFVFDEAMRRKARQYLNVPLEGILIGTVGNQNRQKSHDIFVKISEKLSNHKNYYFRIVGRYTPANAAYYEKHVISYARKLNLYNDHKFDVVDSAMPINEILSAFDLLLLTSMAEGLPTVILEAMSTGLPIVSTDVGSIPEVVRDGKNGYLYAFGEIDKAVQRIETIIENKKIKTKMAVLNRKDAVQKYEITACVAQHVLAYQLALRNADNR